MTHDPCRVVPLLLILPLLDAGCARVAAPSSAEPSHAARNATPRQPRNAATPPGGVSIGLAHGTPAEEATGRQLRRLLETHDLTPWLFTRRVIIDEASVPHSHPILTLHTRHLRNEDHLLSTFIHEEAHWLLDAQPEDTAEAVAEARARFEPLPVGFPDGAGTEQSSYEHLFVIRLEYEGLAEAVGPGRADATFAFWERDHYRALYRLVRTNRADLDAIARRHHLARASATPPAARQDPG
jgi:hypothetical protein